MTVLGAQTIVATLEADDTVLDVIDGSITLDWSWSPYVQGSLTIVTPDDVTGLDPRGVPILVYPYRAMPTLAISASMERLGPISGEFLAGGSTAGPTLGPESTIDFQKLYIRSRSVQDNGTTVLSFQSGEGACHDLRWTSTDLFAAVPSVRVLWDVLFGLWVDPSWPGLPTLPTISGAPAVLYDFDSIAVDDALDAPIPSGAFADELNPMGKTYWDMLDAYVASAELRLWCDELGTFHLSPAAPDAEGALTITGVVAGRDLIDREEPLWVDGVAVEYLPDPADSTRPYIDRHSVGAVSKVFYVKYEVVTPWAGGAVGDLGAAPGIYARRRASGRVVEVTTRNNFAARPNQVTTLEYDGMPTVPASTGIADAITWNFGTALMTVTVRSIEEII